MEPRAARDHSGTEIRPFRINVPQADLDDLRDRLGRARWPAGAPADGWAYGVPLGYLRELAEYWRDTYDWRVHEAELNAFPQFTTVIDGQTTHFLHVRSPEPGAVPLLITHGWPGSVAEFQRILGPLTDPRAYGGDPADAFHVVAPSIPGYGFSGPTTEPGWDMRRVARAFAELMDRLGYARFAAHGGDWGAGISRELGVIAPDRVIGVHLTMLNSAVVPREPDAADLDGLDDAEAERMRESARRSEQFRREETGYSRIQATRPQTLSYGLTDSPIGQLAWIVEKFKVWTDSATTPEDAVDRDQMLTNVTTYWLTATAGSSARLYYESARGGAPFGGAPSTVPTGMAVFPEDLSVPIRRIAERTNNITHWTEFGGGGHFPAMERPDDLVGDVRTFFRTLR